MDAKSNKKSLKAAAVAAGLVGVLLPTGCAASVPASGAVVNAGEPAPGSADVVVVAPPLTAG